MAKALFPFRPRPLSKFCVGGKIDSMAKKAKLSHKIFAVFMIAAMLLFLLGPLGSAIFGS